MAKKIKKVTRAAKKRLILLGIPSSIAIIGFLVCVSLYVIKIYNMKVDQDNLKSNLIDLQAKEADLKIEIEKLQDKEYLAKYARENYQYSKDGELVIQLAKTKEKNKNKEKINIDTKYILYGGAGILSLIFIYILKRKKV